jgi:hypothetical protein
VSKKSRLKRETLNTNARKKIILFSFFSRGGIVGGFSNNGFDFNGRFGWRGDESNLNILTVGGAGNNNFSNRNGGRRRGVGGRGAMSIHVGQRGIGTFRGNISGVMRVVHGVLIVHGVRVVRVGCERYRVGGTVGVPSRRGDDGPIDGRATVDGRVRGSRGEGRGLGIETSRRVGRRGRGCGGLKHRSIHVGECGFKFKSLGKTVEMGDESTGSNVGKAEETRGRDLDVGRVSRRRTGLGAGVGELLVHGV